MRLDEPFTLDARLDATVQEHEFRLRDATGSSSRSKRTERKAVTVLLTTLRQDGRTFHLAAEDTRPPPAPALDLQGLPYRRASVETPETYKLVVKMKRPLPAIVPALASPFNFVYAKKDIDGVTVGVAVALFLPRCSPSAVAY